MKDFVITNIEWDNEKQESGEVYISDVQGKQWSLARLYMTKEQAEEFQRKEAIERCNRDN